MNILQLLKKRRSVRKYKLKKIPTNILHSILEAGRWAPSAGNLQAVRIIIVEDEDKRTELAKAALNQDWMADAPIILAVCSLSDRLQRWFGRLGKTKYSIQDTAAATQNMIIAAAGYGVSSCWVTAFSDNQVRKILDIPDDVDIHNLLVLGYANENPVIPARFHLYELVYFNTWGSSARKNSLFPLTNSMAVKNAKKRVQKTKSKVQDTLFNKFKKTKKK